MHTSAFPRWSPQDQPLNAAEDDDTLATTKLYVSTAGSEEEAGRMPGRAAQVFAGCHQRAATDVPRGQGEGAGMFRRTTADG